MSTKITSRFAIDNWEEEAVSEPDGGPKFMHASVSKTFSGDIEGESTLEYLLITYNDNFSRFVGMERIEGTLNSRTGSFMLRQEGTFENGTARADCRIIKDSGVGELEGISGNGIMEATHEQATLTLTCQFENKQ